VGHRHGAGAVQPSQTFTFVHVRVEPVPSLLRGFSAPVVLETELSDAALFVLLATTTTPSTAGKPARSWHGVASAGGCPGNGAHASWTRPFMQAMRGVLRDERAGRRLQGPGADACPARPMWPSNWNRAWSTRSAFTPRARDQACSCAKPARRLGVGLRDAPGQRRLPPDAVSQPAGVRWPTWH
jgi:hypothetical protein